jgi:WD40 repeat protein
LPKALPKETDAQPRKKPTGSGKRIGRILRWITIIIGSLLVVAVALGILAYWNSRQVADQKNRIQASQLAAASDVELQEDPELALLLATTGLGISPQPVTRARFYSTIFTPFRRSLEGHTDWVWSASFSPDGQRIVTASWDGSAKVWAIYPTLADKLAVAQERLSRGFSEEECRRYFRDDPESCPRTLEQLYALFEDDLQKR